ncbi:hypothetical protein [Dolosigranulum savutiense]|uniref:hypothetical protein n=1 Tax=Dolosigranulum savutiense TaxID=3110288 RepID=UPI0035304576
MTYHHFYRILFVQSMDQFYQRKPLFHYSVSRPYPYFVTPFVFSSNIGSVFSCNTPTSAINSFIFP